MLIRFLQSDLISVSTWNDGKVIVEFSSQRYKYDEQVTKQKGIEVFRLKFYPSNCLSIVCAMPTTKSAGKHFGIK
jgi:hypothetical protein